MVLDTLIGRAIIGREVAKQQGIADPAEQLRLGLVGGMIGSPTLGLIATAAIARQQADPTPTPPDGGTSDQAAIVPDLKGKSLDEAEAELATVGLTLAKSGAFSNEVEAGIIISQTPEPNTQVPVAAVVTLTVSLGPKTAATGVMPLVQGKAIAEAKELILAQAKGKIAENNISIVYSYAKDAQPGQVVMQDPDPGTPIEETTQPTLVVIEAIAVPDLRGKTAVQAFVELSGHKLLTTIDPQDGKGLVIQQNPAAGVEVAVFTVVELTFGPVVEGAAGHGRVASPATPTPS